MAKRAESDFDFFSRRATEESRLAAVAATAPAGAAHRHMASVYSLRVYEEQELAAQLAAERGEPGSDGRLHALSWSETALKEEMEADAAEAERTDPDELPCEEAGQG